MGESSPPKAPIAAKPVDTMLDGVEIESGSFVGRPLSRQAKLDLEDRRAFALAVPTYPADLEALRSACQAPPTAEILKRRYDGEEISDSPAWKGIRVEIIAFRLTPTVGLDGVSGIRVPLGHPWVYEEFPGIDGPCIIARWLHRFPGHDGVLEVIWDGRRFFATQIRRSVHFYGPGNAQDAARLMALWVTDEAGVPQRPRGRCRLEESPSSPWRAYATRARELLATKEVTTIRDAAARLMVDYDSLGDDPIAWKKAERAAAARLGRWLGKLRDLGE